MNKIPIYTKAIYLLLAEKLAPQKLPNEKTITYNNYTISYAKFGTQPKTLVLLHGWSQSKETWKTTIEHLKNHYTIYALDLPGFGKSPPPPQPITLEEYAQIINTFYQKLNIKTSILLGHSFGGKIALIFTHLHPNKTEKLIIYSSSLSTSTPLTIRTRLIRVILQLSALPTLGFPKAFTLFQTTHPNTNFSEIINGINQPKLFIYGKHDPIVTKKKTTPAKNTQILTFQNSTHLAHLEEKEKFIQEIINFIEKQK